MTTTERRIERHSIGTFPQRGSKECPLVVGVGPGDVVTVRFKRSHQQESIRLGDLLTFLMKSRIDAEKTRLAKKNGKPEPLTLAAMLGRTLL